MGLWDPLAAVGQYIIGGDTNEWSLEGAVFQINTSKVSTASISIDIVDVSTLPGYYALTNPHCSVVFNGNGAKLTGTLIIRGQANVSGLTVTNSSLTLDGQGSSAANCHFYNGYLALGPNSSLGPGVSFHDSGVRLGDGSDFSRTDLVFSGDINLAAESRCEIMFQNYPRMVVTLNGASNVLSQCRLQRVDCFGSFNDVRANEVVQSGGTGIYVTGNSNLIRFNQVYSNLTGLVLDGTNNAALGNDIGLSAAGYSGRPNDTGVEIRGWYNQLGGSNNNDGNRIAGNLRNGVLVSSGGGHRVQGNWIGLGADRFAVGNGWAGIMISRSFVGEEISDLLIGGETFRAGNLIASNGTGGIVGWDNSRGSRGTRILNNYIGLATTSDLGIGTFAWGNGAGVLGVGARLQNHTDLVISNNWIGGHNYFGLELQYCTNVTIQANRIGNDEDYPRPNLEAGLMMRNMVQTLVGGTNAAQRNIVSGNANPGRWGVGISIQGRENNNLRITGNYLGVAPNGIDLIPNGMAGVLLYETVNATIGGAAPGEANVIGGSTNGIYFMSADFNTVLGNYIGVDPNGWVRLTNEVGICLENGQTNIIGGPLPGEGNVIANSLLDGIWIKGGWRNHIRGNYIGAMPNRDLLANGRHGIHLGGSYYSVGVNFIGGSTNLESGWQEGNLIMGSAGNGINLVGALTSWTYLNGNEITRNTNHGVFISCNLNRLGETNGNTICENGGAGIYLTNAQNNLFYNNRIGLGRPGYDYWAPNGDHGIVILTNANYNTFGQTRSARPNLVVSGGTRYALYIKGGLGNSFRGNFLGGGDRAAVRVEDTAGGNTFGSGADFGNVIVTRSSEPCLEIVRSDSQSVAGNWIGFLPDNNIPAFVYNAYSWAQATVGLLIVDGKNNWISGSPGNLIGLTREAGVLMMGTTGPEACSYNTLGYNQIGCGRNPTNQAFMTNAGFGVVLSNAAWNTIGSDSSSANYIGGNRVGLYFYNTRSNTVRGNRFGLAANAAIIGNREDAIRGEYGWRDQIGGSYVNNYGNIIVASGWQSGQTTMGADGDGIDLLHCREIWVQGNLIGWDSIDLIPVPNARHGIYAVDSTNLLFGGSVNFRNYIAGNLGHGIFVGGSLANRSAEIYSNRIGTDPTGNNPVPNGGSGIVLEISRGNLIGNGMPDYRNIIAANGGHGIYLKGIYSHHNDINGNYLGTSWDALLPLGNAGHGVCLENAPDNFIGTRSNCHNVIAANGGHGVFLTGTGAVNNLLLSNLVGVTTNFATAMGNGGDGVRVWDGFSNTLSNNLVAANAGNGVLLGSADGGAGRWNRLIGNWVGCNPNGAPLPNQGCGVLVTNASFNNIGPGNVLGANLKHGVEIGGQTSANNLVIGNQIGLSANGVAAGNQLNGVEIASGPNNRVGGTNAWEANTIANNASGVHIAAGTGNPILGNSLFNHPGMGINLGPVGVNNQEQDGVPNRYQNFPTLTNVFRGSTHIYGHLQSAPLQPYLVEFFAGDQTNAAGYAEAKKFLGREWLVTDAAGRAGFGIVYPFTLGTNQWVTATATDTNGNTSELSLAAPVQPPADADADGLPDFFEEKYPGLNHSANGDYDGDGATNYEEYLADTDPKDAASVFKLAQLGDTLQIPRSSAGRAYYWDGATNKAGKPVWLNLQQVEGTGGNLFYHAGSPTNAPFRLFRARAALP